MKRFLVIAVLDVLNPPRVSCSTLRLRASSKRWRTANERMGRRDQEHEGFIRGLAHPATRIADEMLEEHRRRLLGE
jgi:hypothetical protein